MKQNQKSWIRGYCCAIATIIKSDGLVETQIREAFKAGLGDLSISELKACGVDEMDLEVIRTHKKALYK